jgi:hypothetical protein
MSRHLSAEQISAWALGEHAPEVESHAQSCPACRAELTGLDQALVNFRGAVRGWSEEQFGGDFSVDWQRNGVRSWMRFNRLRWAVVFMTLCVLVSGSVLLRRHQRIATEMAATDAALLKQVDAEVSRTVPGAMEPLANMILWDEEREEGARTPKNE